MIQATMQSVTDSARIPRSPAGWRNVIGELAEQLAADKLGAVRLSTGSGERYCPDLRHPQYGDMEVKAVGKSGGVIIYRVRLEKDRWYSATHTLSYVLVIHRVLTPQPSMAEARALMEWAKIYVIPFSIVDAICVSVRPRILNKKYKPANGWCQRGYEMGGYMVRARALIEAFPHGRIQ